MMREELYPFIVLVYPKLDALRGTPYSSDPFVKLELGPSMQAVADSHLTNELAEIVIYPLSGGGRTFRPRMEQTQA